MKNSWLNALNDDLNWLMSIQGQVWGKDLATHRMAWGNRRRGWKNHVKTAVKKQILQDAIALAVFEKVQNQKGRSTASLRAALGKWSCECGREFETHQALAVHMLKTHQIPARESCLSGTRCLACMQELWTRNRLRLHLSYVSRTTKKNLCFSFLEQHGFLDVPNEGETEKVDLPLPGINRRDAVRVAGPLPIGACLDDIAYAETRVGELKQALSRQFGTENFQSFFDQNLYDEIRSSWFDACAENQEINEDLPLKALDWRVNVVTFLIWGTSRKWSSFLEKFSWQLYLEEQPCGKEIFEWYWLNEQLVIMYRIDEADAHREPSNVQTSLERRKETTQRNILNVSVSQLTGLGISLDDAIRVFRPGGSVRHLMSILSRL